MVEPVQPGMVRQGIDNCFNHTQCIFPVLKFCGVVRPWNIRTKWHLIHCFQVHPFLLIVFREFVRIDDDLEMIEFFIRPIGRIGQLHLDVREIEVYWMALTRSSS